MIERVFAILSGFFVAVTPVAAQSPPNQAISLAAEAKRNPELVIDRRTARGLFDGVLKKGGRDVFTLPLKAGEAVDITVSSRSIDPLVEVRSEQGELLASDDDSGGQRDANLRFFRPATQRSVIYVVVLAAQSVAGSYTVELRSLKPRTDIAPLALTVGQSTTGRVDRQSPWRNQDGMGVQRFAFEGHAGDRIRLAVTPIDGAENLELALLAEDGSELGKRSASNPIVVTTLPASGRFEARVAYKPTREESDANFVMSLDVLPPAKLSADPKLIVAGTPIRGRLGPESPVLSPESARPYILYVLRGMAGQRFRASVTLDNTKSAKELGLLSRPTLEVGVDTPAGFASVAATYPQLANNRPATFRFLRDGDIFIRLMGGSGTEATFTLTVEPYSVTPTSSGAR